MAVGAPAGDEKDIAQEFGDFSAVWKHVPHRAELPVSDLEVRKQKLSKLERDELGRVSEVGAYVLGWIRNWIAAGRYEVSAIALQKCDNIHIRTTIYFEAYDDGSSVFVRYLRDHHQDLFSELLEVTAVPRACASMRIRVLAIDPRETAGAEELWAILDESGTAEARAVVVLRLLESAPDKFLEPRLAAKLEGLIVAGRLPVGTLARYLSHSKRSFVRAWLVDYIRQEKEGWRTVGSLLSRRRAWVPELSELLIEVKEEHRSFVLQLLNHAKSQVD